MSERVVGQFLAEMDGVEKLNDVLVLAATNRRDMVDPALLRPGRFDIVIEIDLPDLQERLEILRIQARGKPISPEVDLEALAAATQGCTGADLGAICHRAALHAIRERVQEVRSKKQKGIATRPLVIGPAHFAAAQREART